MYNSQRQGVYVRGGKHYAYPDGSEELPIVGWHSDTAILWLKEHMYDYRTVSINGNAGIVTCDYKPARVNLSVTEGIINDYYYG